MLERKPLSLEIVFCLDASGDNAHLIHSFRNNIDGFGQRLLDGIAEATHQDVEDIRLRVICFRDFSFDKDAPALQCSPFFSLLKEEDKLKAWFEDIEGYGGGDFPESSLEALALAYNSPFSQEMRDRHAIILLTNAYPKPFGLGSENPNYPKDIPATFEELLEKINSFSRHFYTTLVVPDYPAFREIEESCRYVSLVPVKVGDPLALNQEYFSSLVLRAAFGMGI